MTGSPTVQTEGRRRDLGESQGPVALRNRFEVETNQEEGHILRRLKLVLWESRRMTFSLEQKRTVIKLVTCVLFKSKPTVPDLHHELRFPDQAPLR